MEEQEKVVAFLGPRASYTHQATTQQFPESEYRISPLTTIEDVFAAVQAGDASHGVVPFENSTNGSVVFTLDLFADLQGRYPDILVCGEIYLPVHHCLLGRVLREDQTHPSTTDAAQYGNGNEQDLPTVSKQATPRVKPLHDLKHIKKLYSHPQAWGQCKFFLTTYVKDVERQDVSSTSKAAENVAHDTSGTSAAISSKLAADLNGLEVLAESIEDTAGNTTRFFIIRRHQHVPSLDQQTDVDESVGREMYKTLVSFTVDHDAPGALADSLAVFKLYDLNLTNIEKRPSGETEWHYVHFVEFRGRKRRDGEGGAVNDALQELTKVARSWRWLGSWADQLKVKH